MKPARLFALLSLIPASLAFAQNRPEPVVQAEKVVVTDTPLTADAGGTTEVRIDQTVPVASRSLAALGSRVANLHFSSGGAGSFGDLVTLRGLPNTPYFSDPSVTLTFDDIPLGSTFTFPTGLFGFARATIHRGPQATASGRGGEAGAIFLTSAEPGAKAGGELRVGLGDFNARSAALEARSARGEKVDVSVAAAFAERDGYIDNTQLHTRVDDQEGYSAAARLRFRPMKTAEFTLQLLASARRDGAQPLVPLGGPLFTVARGREGSTDVDFGGAAFKAAFDTSVGRLTSTTSRTEWRLAPYDNRLVLPPTLDSRIAQSQRIWNEELRLASETRAPVTWQIGAWFSDSRTHGDINRGLVLPFGVIPIEASTFQLDARTLAAFGEATFAPAAGWKITAGLRGEEVKKDFDRGQTVPGAGRFTTERTFKALLPKLAVTYALAPETNFSASVAQGTKPGGWSAYTANAALARFRAENVTTWEAGVDTTLANKTVTLALRAFTTRIRNYQIERSFNASDYLVVTAPRARSTGGEFEASWRPLPEWTLTATLGLTDVELREFTDPFTGKSYAGNRAPYAPEYDAHLSATYRLPSGWFAGADVAATGNTFYDESENALFASGKRTVANARLGYETSRWRVSVYGENLADEDYYTLIIPGVRHGAPGAPRTWGIEAAMKW